MSAPPSSGSKRGTHTVPDVQRAGVLDGPDLVKALLLYGTDTIYLLSPLPPGARYYSLGSGPKQDIVISSPYVSAHHDRLAPTRSGLKVADQKSKNGTYFEGKRQRKPFEVSPGKTFFVGARSHQLVALNAQMWTHYDELAAILGYEDEHVIRSETPSPSDLIVAAVNGPHILITSEPNCEQARLAHIVHEISQLHERPLVAVDHPEEGLQAQIDLIEHRAATVLLDLGDNDIRLDPTFVSRLFSTRYQTRVIALARTVDVASRALGERHVKRMKHVWLEPLSGRKIAILRLMDRMFRKHGSSLRVQALPTHNQAALRNHQWEKNFASLEEVAERLIVILREPSLRKAAAVLGLHHNTLQNWHTNIMGMELPSHDESER